MIREEQVIVSLSLPAGMACRLNNLGALVGMNRSALVRFMVEEFLPAPQDLRAEVSLRECRRLYEAFARDCAGCSARMTSADMSQLRKHVEIVVAGVLGGRPRDEACEVIAAVVFLSICESLGPLSQFYPVAEVDKGGPGEKVLSPGRGRKKSGGAGSPKKSGREAVIPTRMRSTTAKPAAGSTSTAAKKARARKGTQ